MRGFSATVALGAVLLPVAASAGADECPLAAAAKARAAHKVQTVAFKAGGSNWEMRPGSPTNISISSSPRSSG